MKIKDRCSRLFWAYMANPCMRPEFYAELEAMARRQEVLLLTCGKDRGKMDNMDKR